MEYLYAQTNAVLEVAEPECMEEAVVVDEDFDEGFEDASEVEDLTQPWISATSASTRHSVRAAPPEDQQTSSLGKSRLQVNYNLCSYCF